MYPLAIRTKKARKNCGLSQGKLSEISSVPQATISKIERGDQEESLHTIRLASAMGVDPLWLSGGAGVDDQIIFNSRAHSSEVNTAETELTKYTPVVSLNDAGHLNWREEIPSNCVLHKLGRHLESGANDIAVLIDTNSMAAPYGISFPEGCMVYASPDIASRSGSFVIVRLDETGETTFKQYKNDAGRKLLVPLNQSYPTIDVTDQEFTICGVVFFKCETITT